MTEFTDKQLWTVECEADFAIVVSARSRKEAYRLAEERALMEVQETGGLYIKVHRYDGLPQSWSDGDVPVGGTTGETIKEIVDRCKL